MSRFRFTVDGQMLPERRSLDRRDIQEADSVHSLWSSRHPFVIPILLILLGVGLWQRRYVANAPLWLARAHRADRSDLYIGSTNGISNRNLVDQARNYLTDIDHLDASGNVTAPEALRPLGVHLDVSWFRRHTPDSVDFNPFAQAGGKFVVTWLYYPGCEKAVWKSARTDTDWYNLRGRPCFPLCRLSVLMAPDLRLTTIALNSL